MTKWFYHSDGEQLGPHEEAEMIQLAKDGKITPSDKVWNSSMGEHWAEASTIAAFFPVESVSGSRKLGLKNRVEPKPEPAPGSAAPQPLVMQHLNAAKQTREAQAVKKGYGGLVLKLLVVAVIIAGGIVAAKHFTGGSHKARIESMVAAGGPALGHAPAVWVSMQFMELPEAGDPKDVKLVFKAPCLKRDLTFDWADIAVNPFVRPSRDSVKKKPAEGISPDKPPKLNYRFDTPLPVPMEALRRTVDRGTRLRLTAELHWAGEKVHSKSCSVGNWYVGE